MANTLKTPKVMPSEFCTDGDKNTILTSPSTSNPQLANFSTGFPAITQTPIPNGGIPPERADFNGMFNLLSSALVYIQNGGQWTFVPEVSNAIGGYPAGAILNYYDAKNKVNKRVISNINNNVNNFLLDPSQIGDSSKPWSYTDNTPIVQNLTNPSADTVPSTKAVKDESSRLNSDINNKVNKSGDTMTGTLKVKNGNIETTGGLYAQNIEFKPNSTTQNNGGWIDFHYNNSSSDYTIRIIEEVLGKLLITGHLRLEGSLEKRSVSAYNDTPTTDIQSILITFVDKNSNEYAQIKGMIQKDSNSLYFMVKDKKGIWHTSCQARCNEKLSYLTSGQNDAIGSVVTTILKSSSSFKLGNGLLIQWGSMKTGASALTFDLPFLNNTYFIGTLPNYTQAVTSAPCFQNKTTTGCTIHSSNAYSLNWIAIGKWY